MKKEKKVPKLRFKEFKDDWEMSTLGNVSSEVMYGLNSAATSFDGVNKYIRITDIDDASRQFEPNPLCSPEGEIDERYVVRENDLLFARTGASVGKSYLYNPKDGRLLFAGFLIKFSVTAANTAFVFAQTLTKSYSRWVTKVSTRTGQPGINAEEYKALKLFLPCIKEQQKIASFLTAVDDKIQQLTKKKALLEQYKKGVMQQIFSRQIRFKDENGKEYPEWEEKRLGEIAEIITGSTPPTANKEFYNGDCLFVSPADIQNNRYVTSTATKVTKAGFQKGRLITKGSVLFVCIGSTIGKVAQAGADCISNQQINSLISYQNLLPHFLFSLLQFEAARIRLLAGEQAVPIINKSAFSAITVDIPCIEEQKKIGDFLLTVDYRIERIARQIQQTQQFKKGLLQQMFV